MTEIPQEPNVHEVPLVESDEFAGFVATAHDLIDAGCPPIYFERELVSFGWLGGDTVTRTLSNLRDLSALALVGEGVLEGSDRLSARASANTYKDRVRDAENAVSALLDEMGEATTIAANEIQFCAEPLGSGCGKSFSFDTSDTKHLFEFMELATKQRLSDDSEGVSVVMAVLDGAQEELDANESELVPWDEVFDEVEEAAEAHIAAFEHEAPRDLVGAEVFGVTIALFASLAVLLAAYKHRMYGRQEAFTEAHNALTRTATRLIDDREALVKTATNTDAESDVLQAAHIPDEILVDKHGELDHINMAIDTHRAASGPAKQTEKGTEEESEADIELIRRVQGVALQASIGGSLPQPIGGGKPKAAELHRELDELLSKQQKRQKS